VTGVGKNLQDHLEIYLQQACTQPVSLYPSLKWWNQARIGIQWYTSKTGIGASNQFEAGGFIKSNSHCNYPNLQFHFLPIAIRYDGTNDHRDAPKFQFNYLSTDQDKKEWIEAIHKTREIFSQAGFDDFRGRELSPGDNVQSEEDLLEFVRNNGESAYHPCGTCKMGYDDQAVVDSSLRVHGLEGLRVVDASIFPTITNCNLNCTTIMTAEKAADIIKGNQV